MRDDDDFGTAKRKGRGPVLMVIAGGLVAAIAGGVVLSRADAKKKREAIDAGYARTATCLLGEAPADPAVAAAKARAIQLAVLGRAQGEGAWPARCEAPARELQKALLDGAGELPGSAKLSTAIEAMVKAIHGSAGAEPIAEPIAATFREAIALGLKGGVATDAPKPPAAISVPGLHELPATSRIGPAGTKLAHVHRSFVRGETLLFTIDPARGGEPPTVCLSRDATIRCRAAHPSVGKLVADAQPWASFDGDAPVWLFAGDRGDVGIVRAVDGVSIPRARTYGAHAYADGRLGLLLWDEKKEAIEWRLHGTDAAVVSSTVVASRKETRFGNPYYGTAAFFDWVFWKQASDESAGGFDVYGLSLADPKAKPERVGPSTTGIISKGEKLPHFGACKHGDALVVRAKAGHAWDLFFRMDGRWYPPVHTGATAGELTCNGADAFLTSVLDFEGPTVSSWRCTVSSCEPWRLQMREAMKAQLPIAPSSTKWVRALEMGGKLGVVWRAGDLGALRLRIARPEDFGKAEDVLLFDDLRTSAGVQAISAVTDFALLPGKGYALLLLETSEGLYAMHLSPQGGVTPATLQGG